MEEYLDIVDKKDKVVGTATRKQCHSDKKKIHREIAVFVFNNSGRILIQKRSKKKDLYKGLYTSSCSGHIHSGEDYESAAVRELKEELGIVVSKKKLKKILKTILIRPKETEFHTLYVLQHDGKITIDTEELDSVKWLTVEELKKKISEKPKKFSKDIVILFKKYLETLKNKNRTTTK